MKPPKLISIWLSCQFLTAQTLEVVHISESPFIVTSGDPVDLQCAGNAEIRFCYWLNERTGSRFSTTRDAFSNKTSDDNIEFDIDDFNCNLIIKAPFTHSNENAVVEVSLTFHQSFIEFFVAMHQLLHDAANFLRKCTFRNFFKKVK